ncbi:MAG: hypothetical protein V9E94_11900 [Microthrixaceae bacterium]
MSATLVRWVDGFVHLPGAWHRDLRRYAALERSDCHVERQHPLPQRRA